MSDGRGDRRAEERQNGGQTVRRDEGEEETSLVRGRVDERGKCVRGRRKRKKSVVSHHHPARAEW